MTILNRRPEVDSNIELDLRPSSADSAAMAAEDLSDIYLERVDPSRNLARFYAVSIQLNLFGEPTLIRMFGRIDKVGRALVETFADVSSAELARTAIVNKKLKRGYVPLATTHHH